MQFKSHIFSVQTWKIKATALTELETRSAAFPPACTWSASTCSVKFHAADWKNIQHRAGIKHFTECFKLFISFRAILVCCAEGKPGLAYSFFFFFPCTFFVGIVFGSIYLSVIEILWPLCKTLYQSDQVSNCTVLHYRALILIQCLWWNVN